MAALVCMWFASLIYFLLVAHVISHGLHMMGMGEKVLEGGGVRGPCLKGYSVGRQCDTYVGKKNYTYKFHSLS